jgi:hypothetical protein
MKNQKTVLIGFIILTAITAAVSFYGINKFYALEVKKVFNEIDFQCAQTYRYTESVSTKVSVSYPMKQEYADCVSKKGNLK